MAEPAGIFSGGPIQPFAGGWAMIPFVGERAHFWTEETAIARTMQVFKDRPADQQWFMSLCHVPACTTEKVPALNPGTVKLCKRCQKIAPRWTRKEERKTFLEAMTPADRAALAAPFQGKQS